jgi:hypothetical protein
VLRGVVIVVVCSARIAHAEVDVVKLDYAAPDGCPDRDAFVAQIVERAPAVRFEITAPRTFAVEIVATPDGFAGTLVVDSTADKQLAAARCDDLASALALVTALAIDPTIDLTAAPAKPTPPPVAIREPARAPASRWRPDVTAGALVDTGVTPDPVLAGVVQWRASWTRLAVETSFIGGRDTTMHDGSTATFTWLAVQPAACLVMRRTLELAGCGHVELGLVRAAGEEIVNGRALNRLWWTAGVHGDARWPTQSRGFVQLQLGISIPLTRDRYRFNPGVVVHETSAVTAWLGLGVGVRFR